MSKLCKEPKKPITNRSLYSNNSAKPVKTNKVMRPDRRLNPGSLFKLVFFEIINKVNIIEKMGKKYNTILTSNKLRRIKNKL